MLQLKYKVCGVAIEHASCSEEVLIHTTCTAKQEALILMVVEEEREREKEDEEEDEITVGVVMMKK